MLFTDHAIATTSLLPYNFSLMRHDLQRRTTPGLRHWLSPPPHPNCPWLHPPPSKPLELRLAAADFDKCDIDANYMSTPTHDPSEQNFDNNQIGYDRNMNAFHDSICNALMCEIL
jgi:hypothetical protein